MSLKQAFFLKFEKFLILIISFGLTYLLITIASLRTKQEFYTQGFIRIHLPDHLTTIGPSEHSIKVKLSFKHDLTSLWQEHTNLQGDLYLLHLKDPGLIQTKLTKDLFHDLPDYINVTFPEDYLECQIDHKVKESRIVKPIFKSDFVLKGTLTVNPQSIDIEGPLSEIEKISHIPTLPIEQSFLIKSSILRVGLDESNLKSFEFSQNWVDLVYIQDKN
jgi:hypothetical protein